MACVWYDALVLLHLYLLIYCFMTVSLKEICISIIFKRSLKFSYIYFYTTSYQLITQTTLTVPAQAIGNKVMVTQ